MDEWGFWGEGGVNEGGLWGKGGSQWGGGGFGGGCGVRGASLCGGHCVNEWGSVRGGVVEWMNGGRRGMGVTAGGLWGE